LQPLYYDYITPPPYDAFYTTAVRDARIRYPPTATGLYGGFVFAFGDGGAGNGSTVVLHTTTYDFVSSSWTLLGPRGFSGGEVQYLDLELTSGGVPVVAFSKQ
jgi:hypothetical protein